MFCLWRVSRVSCFSHIILQVCRVWAQVRLKHTELEAGPLWLRGHVATYRQRTWGVQVLGQPRYQKKCFLLWNTCLGRKCSGMCLEILGCLFFFYVLILLLLMWLAPKSLKCKVLVFVGGHKTGQDLGGHFPLFISCNQSRSEKIWKKSYNLMRLEK